MIIQIENLPGDYAKFNVSLHTAAGKDAFLTIRGCKMMNGSKGPFVSWPATKNEKTEKWWNHVVSSKEFGAAVLAEVSKAAPPKAKPAPDDDSEIPF
jgi:DNA-binding cell septation regulator SpoVG